MAEPGAETSTQAAPADAGQAAAPATQAAPATAQTAWSLDTWQPDQWDALPERIRTAADARYKGQYEPRLTEAQTALKQHQDDLAAARREAQDAKTAHMRGDAYGATRAREAEEKLAALQKEHETYKGQWSEQSFAQKWDAERKTVNDTFNREWREATGRELRFAYPWYEAKVGGQDNPRHDAARAKLADELDNQFWEIAKMSGGDAEKHPLATLERAYFLEASGLNAAQRHSLLTQIASGMDPLAALQAASRPPAHVASPAARAAPGAPRAPRPDEGVSPRRQGERTAQETMRDAARRTLAPRNINADT